MTDPVTSKESPTVQMLRMWLTNWEASLRAYDKRCAGPLDELHLIVDSAPAPETLPQQLSPSGPSTSTTLLERASLAGAGRQLSETPAFTVEELMHEIHAAHAHTMWRNMPDGRSVPNLCQCRFCKSMGPNALKASDVLDRNRDERFVGKELAPQCTCGSPSPALHANGCPVNGLPQQSETK